MVVPVEGDERQTKVQLCKRRVHPRKMAMDELPGAMRWKDERLENLVH